MKRSDVVYRSSIEWEVGRSGEALQYVSSQCTCCCAVAVSCELCTVYVLCNDRPTKMIEEILFYSLSHLQLCSVGDSMLY